MSQSRLTALTPELVLAIADFSTQADIDALRGTCRALHQTLDYKTTCSFLRKTLTPEWIKLLGRQ